LSEKLSGQLYEVSLTKREIGYLENLVLFELSEMKKANIANDFFEKRTCLSILERLKDCIL
jgi:hypothetical protein